MTTKAPKRDWHCTHKVTVERYTAERWTEVAKHPEAEVRILGDHHEYGGKLAALYVPQISDETGTWYTSERDRSFSYTKMYSATLDFWGTEDRGFWVTGYIESPEYSGQFFRCRWYVAERRRRKA